MIVGLYMLSNVISIDFSDMSEAIPCYVCIIAMPFFYSISEGIAMGVISYVAIQILSGKAKEKNDQRDHVHPGCSVYLKIPSSVMAFSTIQNRIKRLLSHRFYSVKTGSSFML